MNGGQDLGGVHGFGPVLPEAEEPVFHADWEKRALGLTLCMGATGAWTIDMSRHARENRPPHRYLAMSYYEVWMAGLERLVLDHGLATAEELAAGAALSPSKPVKRVLAAADVAETLARGSPTERRVGFEPRFKVGAEVTTRQINPLGHCRLPRYARGKRGVVTAHHGAHVFPDASAHGHGEAPHHLYTVRFSARELWGPDTTADEVRLDLSEPYLEAVHA